MELRRKADFSQALKNPLFLDDTCGQTQSAELLNTSSLMKNKVKVKVCKNIYPSIPVGVCVVETRKFTRNSRTNRLHKAVVAEAVSLRGRRGEKEVIHSS